MPQHEDVAELRWKILREHTGKYAPAHRQQIVPQAWSVWSGMVEDYLGLGTNEGTGWRL